MTALVPENTTGGLILAPGGAAGGLITGPGQVQYGDMLMGGGTSAGWRDLAGWRDTPDTSQSDTPRPQAHGSYPGEVWGESQLVTFTYLLRGRTAAKLEALRLLELYLPLDGVERPLVVHDGAAATMRMARVLQRHLPMDKAFLVGPLECSVQWVCADPRRYSLAELTTPVTIGTATGGLVYPLVYPLSYGTTIGGDRSVTNDGSTAAPFRATFTGPLINPMLTSDQGWKLAFKITLADGETLVVDTSEGTALLNGATDRLYTIDPLSSPLERCLLPPGATTLALGAASGSGSASVTYRHAYL
jgi:hypothetical protein